MSNNRKIGAIALVDEGRSHAVRRLTALSLAVAAAIAVAMFAARPARAEPAASGLVIPPTNMAAPSAG